MASSAPISGLLECSVCYEHYDRNTRVPKLLPCEHTFCLACLTSLSVSTGSLDEVECPICRAKHSVPSSGFTTSRAMLDIVDQLQKDITATSSITPRPSTPPKPSGLKCKRHKDTECVLVCIDCVTLLCTGCVRQHRGHTLEGLSDATDLLRPAYEMQILQQQAELDSKINEAESTVAKFNKAETDINKICDDIVELTESWRRNQLFNVQSFKQLAVTRRDEAQIERGILQSQIEQSEIETIIMTLTPDHQQKKQSSDKDYVETVGSYNFTEQAQLLLGHLQSFFSDQGLIPSVVPKKNTSAVEPFDKTISQNTSIPDPWASWSAKKKTPVTEPLGGRGSMTNVRHPTYDDRRARNITKVIRTPRSVIALINDDIVSYDFNTKRCELWKKHSPKTTEYKYYMLLKNDVQHDTSYINYVNEIRAFYFSLYQ